MEVEDGDNDGKRARRRMDKTASAARVDTGTRVEISGGASFFGWRSER